MENVPSKNTAPMISVILGVISLALAVSPILGGLPRLLPFPSYSVIALVLGIVGLVLGLKGRHTEQKGLAKAGLLLCSLTLLVSLGFGIFLGYIVFSLQSI